MNLDKARFNMIEQQIRPWDVLDTEVLALLSEVRREMFVPAAHKSLAFVDMEIPLQGSGKDAGQQGQCMLAPRVEARLLQDAGVTPSDKVLEIGTGSGYMAALLGRRGQRVITLEIDPALAHNARQNLQAAGIQNVDVREGDGARGQAVDGPFDVIMLSGSVAQVPHGLLEQLKIGGRLMAILGDAPIMQVTRITRTGSNDYRSQPLWDTVAPRLLNFAEHPRFHF